MNEIKKIFDIFQNISLTIIFQHNVDKDASWNEHKTNKDYTLWLVTSGNIIVETDDNAIKASTHDVILFYPGDTYSAHTDCEKCSFIFLFFKMGTGNMIDIFHSRNASGLYYNKELNKQAKIFQKNYFKRKRTGENYMLSSLCDFMQLLSTMFTTADFTPLENKKKVNVSQELVRTLIYIHEHCTENLSVKELARNTGMSEKYFISKFNHDIGISPKRYQIECRMKLAASLLITSHDSIAQISQSVGYPDQYSFSKAFSKYYGESPSAFRSSL